MRAAVSDVENESLALARIVKSNGSFTKVKLTPSIADDADCSLMLGRELTEGTVHCGKYIVLQTQKHPLLTDGYLSILAADTQGLFVDLRLYHNSFTAIPPHCLLRIKEPLCVSVKPSLAEIRVDHPSDVRIPSVEVPIPSFGVAVPLSGDFTQDYRIRGNAAFRTKEYRLAISFYSMGLLRNSGDWKLYLNRAASYLQLSHFDLAKEDCESYLHYYPKDAKAMYRLARSLYGLGQIEEAYRKAKVTATQAPISDQVNELLRSCRNRMEESVQGKYNWQSIVKETASSQYPRLDCADFVGPIEIRSSLGRGRGLYLTADAKQGQLLVVSKAAAITYRGEFARSCPGQSTYSDEIELSFLLPNLLSDYITGNPCRSSGIMDLFAGDQFRSLTSKAYGQGVFNALQLHATVKYNSFEFDVTGYTYNEDPLMEGLGIQDFSIMRGEAAGLWRLPAYANHSCVPNAVWYHIGDLMVIRAAQDLARHTEITIAYTHPYQNYDIREAKFREYGFSCECELCTLDRDDGKEERVLRIRLLERAIACRSVRTDEQCEASTRSQIATIRRMYDDMFDSYERCGRRRHRQYLLKILHYWYLLAETVTGEGQTLMALRRQVEMLVSKGWYDPNADFEDLIFFAKEMIKANERSERLVEVIRGIHATHGHLHKRPKPHE